VHPDVLVLAAKYAEAEESPFISPRITLRADGSYLYENTGGSCWLWWTDHGRWERDGDLFILISTGDEETSPTDVFSERDASVDGIVVLVQDSSGGPVAAAEVRLGWDSPKRCTDDSGRARFTPTDLEAVQGRAEWVTIATESWTATHVVPSGNIFRVQLRDPSAPPERRKTYFAFHDGDLFELGGAGSHLVHQP